MGTFVFDAWKDRTPEQLKDDCRRLNRALHRWQIIAMMAAEGDLENLPDEWRLELLNLITAYQD